MKADVMTAGRRAQMHAALELRPEHENAAFARRAADGDRRGSAAIALRQTKL